MTRACEHKGGRELLWERVLQRHNFQCVPVLLASKARGFHVRRAPACVYGWPSGLAVRLAHQMRWSVRDEGIRLPGLRYRANCCLPLRTRCRHPPSSSHKNHMLHATAHASSTGLLVTTKTTMQMHHRHSCRALETATGQAAADHAPSWLHACCPPALRPCSTGGEAR